MYDRENQENKLEESNREKQSTCKQFASCSTFLSEKELDLLRQDRDAACTILKKCQHQLRALVESTQILAQLASMDTSHYIDTLGEIPLEQTLSKPGAGTLQFKIDQIQNTWKLEETPIPQLLHSIHRFHSVRQQLDLEAKADEEELKKMEERLRESEKRQQALENAVRKLHNKNQSLKIKLSNNNQERDSMIKAFKTYIRDVKQEGDDKWTKQQMQIHEQILRFDPKRNIEAAVGNRSRGNSVESTLSDLDVGDLYPVAETQERDLFPTISSLSSSSSSRSFVTDENTATLRFQSMPTIEPISSTEDRVISTFSAGTKIGVQFCKVELEPKSSEKQNDLLNTGDTSSNGRSFTLNLLRKNQPRWGLVVCGTHGFCSESIIKPQIGMLLTYINETSVFEKNLKMKDVEEMIKGKEKDPSFTLIFDSIEWTEQQTSLIDTAAKLEAARYLAEWHRSDQEDSTELSKPLIDDINISETTAIESTRQQSSRAPRRALRRSISILLTNKRGSASSSDYETDNINS